MPNGLAEAMTLAEVLADRKARYQNQADEHDAQATIYRERASSITRITTLMDKLTATEQDDLRRIIRGEV